jgi:hypothetical protein
MRYFLCVFVCLNQMTDFYESSSERYAIKGSPISSRCNVLQSVIIKWRTHKLVNWEQHFCL